MIARRITTCALALSLVAGALPARATAGEPSESKLGVLAAIMCGFALKLAIPAPVPWAGVAVGACAIAFLDALASPDSPADQAPPPKP